MAISKWDFSIFFIRQYFINTFISDFDFLKVDRHEWTRFINMITEKIGKMGYFGHKHGAPS